MQKHHIYLTVIQHLLYSSLKHYLTKVLLVLRLNRARKLLAMKIKKLLIRLGITLVVLFALYVAYMYSIFLPKFDEAFRRVKTEEKVVALTYDDGPHSPYTEEILDILDKHDVKATFFMLGMNIESHREVAIDVVNRGHQVGNHSYSHPHLVHKPKEFIAREIAKTDSILLSIGVPANSHFRPPYGQHMFRVHQIMKEQGRSNVLFDVIPGDWKDVDGSVLADKVAERVKPGSIILLHDGGGIRQASVKATDLLIEELHKQGYKFVTTEELMAYKGD